MVLLSVQLAICFLLRSINLRLNRKKLAALQAEKEKRGWTNEDVQREREAHAFQDLTDKQWGFSDPSTFSGPDSFVGRNPFFLYTA